MCIRDRLNDTYAILWRVQMAARLISNGPLGPDNMGSGGMAVLLRATGSADVQQAEAKLAKAHAAARAVIDAAVCSEMDARQ